MTAARFTVEFHGEAPDPLKVGDVVSVSGRATVRAIDGGLVDITSLGRDPEFILGEITVALVANRFEVER